MWQVYGAWSYLIFGAWLWLALFALSTWNDHGGAVAAGRAIPWLIAVGIMHIGLWVYCTNKKVVEAERHKTKCIDDDI